MKFYKIVLLIHHPNIDPKAITSELGLEPFIGWKAGDIRITPKGTLLGGTRADSRWNHIFEFRDEEGYFLEKVTKIADDIYCHREFFQKISLEKERIYLSVDVPGSIHQGDSLDYSTLKKLFDMKIELGFQVFPDWYEDEKSDFGKEGKPNLRIVE